MLLISALLTVTSTISSCEVEFTPEPIPKHFQSNPKYFRYPDMSLQYEADRWNDGVGSNFPPTAMPTFLDRPTGPPGMTFLQPGQLSGESFTSMSDINAEKIIEFTKADAEFAGVCV